MIISALLQYNWNQPIAAMYCPPAKSGQCPEPCLIVNAQGAPWAETWPRRKLPITHSQLMYFLCSSIYTRFRLISHNL